MANAKSKKTTSQPKKAAVVANMVHGTEITNGDIKKGGSAKSAVVTLMSLDNIQIQEGFNPRKVIGSMNDMICDVQLEPTEAFRRKYPERDDEDGLNHTPFSAIGSKNRYEFPDKAWSAAIARLAE